MVCVVGLLLLALQGVSADGVSDLMAPLDATDDPAESVVRLLRHGSAVSDDISLALRHVRLESSASVDDAPSSTLRFDVHNEGDTDLADIELSISLLGPPINGVAALRTVLVRPFTIRLNSPEMTADSRFSVSRCGHVMLRSAGSAIMTDLWMDWPRRGNVTAAIMAVMAWCLLLPAEGLSADVRLLNLQNELVDPFAVASAKAVVVLFVRTDCPISNRYAPEVRRLHEKFAPLGVAFWLVYANPAEPVERIQDHVKAFAYSGGVLRDPGHALVKVANATVTPEVAVFDARRELVYRGRIDDRYVDFGLDRQAPTKHDLENALTAVLTGTPVPEPITKAVGCFLSDLR